MFSSITRKGGKNQPIICQNGKRWTNLVAAFPSLLTTTRPLSQQGCGSGSRLTGSSIQETSQGSNPKTPEPDQTFCYLNR